MAVFRGLNTVFSLNDIDNSREALENLNLNLEDLDTIRGISESVDSRELKLLAGLVDDQRKEFVTLSNSSSAVNREISDLTDFKFPFLFNYVVDGPVRGEAIKFNFLDYDNINNIAQADISTSRVSSWSSLSPGEILYGGDLEIVGGKLSVSDIEIINDPIEKTFVSEIATHEIQLVVNDQVRTLYAMKGIPLVFNTFFKSATFRHVVTQVPGDSQTLIRPTWKIIRDRDGISVDSGGRTPGSGLSIGGPNVDTQPQSFAFNGVSSEARTVEFYYNPALIQRLDIERVNLIEWPNIVLPTLERLELRENDLSELPQFGSGSNVAIGGTYDGLTGGANLAPSLVRLTVAGNNLSRAVDEDGNSLTANTQLQYLPTSLEYLDISGAFSDNETIDITYLSNLKTFYMFDYYTSSTTSGPQRNMLAQTVDPSGAGFAGTTPRVNAGSIEDYRFYDQPFTRLCDDVCDSTSLRILSIQYGNITQKESGGNITLASSALSSFDSRSNSHNIVNVQGKTSLTSYLHYVSRGLPTTNNGVDRNIIAANSQSIFQGCSALSSINFYATDVEGPIQSGFTNLPNLRILETRFTRLSGQLTGGSFSGSPLLQRLYMAGSLYDSAQFFGDLGAFQDTPGLIVYYCYSNNNIRGTIKNGTTELFANLPNLRVVYMPNLGISGDLPTFATAQRTYYINFGNCNLSGTLPNFQTNEWRYIYLYNNDFTAMGTFVGLRIFRIYLFGNQITGTIADFSQCPNLQLLRLERNQLTGYIEGSLAVSTRLSLIDFSSNNLNGDAGVSIINDLYANWDANKRGGVTANFLNNGTNFTDTFLTSEASGVADKLATLRANGWSISLDP